MNQLRRIKACAAMGIALVIIIVTVLTLTACGYMLYPAFPPPPTALPPWPSGAHPPPRSAYPAQTATTESPRTGCEGWSFRPTVDIKVSALGLYDDGHDGLRSPHRAAIIDTESRKPVVETVVQGRSPLDGDFRWEPVGPVVLKGGHEYALVWDCPSPSDPQIVNPRNAPLGLELLYIG